MGIQRSFFDQGSDDGDNGLTILYDDVPEEVPEEVIVLQEDPVIEEFVGEFIEGE